MKIIALDLPINLNDLKEIENIISTAGWLSTTFNFLEEEQFQLPTYIFNEDIDFRVLLDRNFTSELMKIFSSVTADSEYRLSKDQKIVAAHQAFFQLANITSEPNLSYYEYADKNSYDKVITELNKFRIADNLLVENWVDLALGRGVAFSDENLTPINNGTQFSQKAAQKKLKNFEANFIIIKKAISLKKSGISNQRVMMDLMEWLHREYLFTAPSILFLNYYFCPHKPGLKKMIKNYGLEGLRNATWDLTFLQEFYKKVKNEINQLNNERWLACSNDNAIKKIIPLMFANHEEELEDFQRRLKEAFIIAWGKNTGIGKKIYKTKCKYHRQFELESRKVNQDNFRQHVEKIKKDLDKDLSGLDFRGLPGRP